MQNPVKADIHGIGKLFQFAPPVLNRQLGAARKIPAESFQREVEADGVQRRGAQPLRQEAHPLLGRFRERNGLPEIAAQRRGIERQISLQQFQAELECGQRLAGFIMQLARQALALFFLRIDNLLGQLLHGQFGALAPGDVVNVNADAHGVGLPCIAGLPFERGFTQVDFAGAVGLAGFVQITHDVGQSLQQRMAKTFVPQFGEAGLRNRIQVGDPAAHVHLDQYVGVLLGEVGELGELGFRRTIFTGPVLETGELLFEGAQFVEELGLVLCADFHGRNISARTRLMAAAANFAG